MSPRGTITGWALVPAGTAALAALLGLAGCDALEPDCNIRPDLSARDTTVAAFDSVRIQASGKDACGKPLRYLWSFDRGETYDTTGTGTLVRYFGRADIGQKPLRIRAMTDQGRVSSALDITLTVVERRFAWRPARDTLISFGEEAARVDLTPAAPIPGIASYCLRPYPTSACTDSSLTPVFPIKSPRTLYGVEKFHAEVRLASGARSDTAGYTVLSRPTLVGPLSGYSILAVPLADGALRVILPSVADTGRTNPRNGRKLAGVRTLDFDAAGKVVSERVSRPDLDLGFFHFAARPDGTGLFLGVDNLLQKPADLLAGGLDADGKLLWTRSHELDTSYTEALAVHPKADGTWRVVMTGYASVGAGNGKPAVVTATAIHFIDLSATGDLLKDKRVLVPGLTMSSPRVARLPDGGTVVAGMGAAEGSREWQPLRVLRHDADGNEVWSRTFRSQVGTSRPDLLEVGADGNLILAGTDFGQPLSHWTLRLDPADGRELAYRIVVPPAGWGISGKARNTQGTLLHSANGQEKGNLLWAVDADGTEKWRLAFERGTTDTHLSKLVPLPDGGFLVTGQAMLGPYHNDPEGFLFRVDAEGNIEW